MRNTVTKGNLGRERLLAASSCIVHHEGKSGQEAKAGTEAEIREALPKVGGPSTSIIKKMPPKTCIEAILMEAFCQLWFPLPF